jgi:hypothetical protein
MIRDQLRRSQSEKFFNLFQGLRYGGFWPWQRIWSYLFCPITKQMADKLLEE